MSQKPKNFWEWASMEDRYGNPLNYGCWFFGGLFTLVAIIAVCIASAFR